MTKFNSSYVGLRRELIRLVDGQSLKVLDVGCATGTNGRFLKDNNIATLVYGIELDENMADQANDKYDRVFVGDLNDLKFLDSIIIHELKFDYILLGDILEHLINPEIVLKRLKTFLDRNGKIIISLPNIAHIETFIQIFVHGTFPRNERGIFDKTHLRWYTKNDAFRLVNSCGLSVVLYIPKFRARDPIGSKFNWFYKCIRTFKEEWMTFQHILVCHHAEK